MINQESPSSQSVAVIDRVRRQNERQKMYAGKYQRQKVQANNRYWKRQRIIAKLLLANPHMTFVEARAKAFEQVPTPIRTNEVTA